jgi:hypothetical protein
VTASTEWLGHLSGNGAEALVCSSGAGRMKAAFGPEMDTRCMLAVSCLVIAGASLGKQTLTLKYRSLRS